MRPCKDKLSLVEKAVQQKFLKFLWEEDKLLRHEWQFFVQFFDKTELLMIYTIERVVGHYLYS